MEADSLLLDGTFGELWYDVVSNNVNSPLSLESPPKAPQPQLPVATAGRKQDDTPGVLNPQYAWEIKQYYR